MKSLDQLTQVTSSFGKVMQTLSKLPETAKNEPKFNVELAKGMVRAMNDLLKALKQPLDKV